MNVLQCKQVFREERIKMYIESKFFTGFEMLTVRQRDQYTSCIT